MPSRPLQRQGTSCGSKHPGSQAEMSLAGLEVPQLSCNAGVLVPCASSQEHKLVLQVGSRRLPGPGARRLQENKCAGTYSHPVCRAAGKAIKGNRFHCLAGALSFNKSTSCLLLHSVHPQALFKSCFIQTQTTATYSYSFSIPKEHN